MTAEGGPALRTADFDYPLPEDLVASHPADRRDESRLLVLERRSGSLTDRRFPDLLEYLDHIFIVQAVVGIATPSFNLSKDSRISRWLGMSPEELKTMSPYENIDQLSAPLYLIHGTHSALLIDTGCGLFPLKPIIQELVPNKKLIIVNTHSHFDHIGGNSEFEIVYIHKDELNEITNPTDISFLKDSPKEITKRFEGINYTYQPCKNIQPLKSDDTIDLGEITVKIIHTPGHSSGSISLLTNKDDLFTGDTAHYGTMYVSKEEIPIHLSSVSKLLEICQLSETIELYPSHETYGISKKLLTDLYESMQKIDKLWETKKWDEFLEGWIIYDINFAYVVF